MPGRLFSHLPAWLARRLDSLQARRVDQALAAAGADGGGTTGPMSPSGASSRSTMTGA